VTHKPIKIGHPLALYGKKSRGLSVLMPQKIIAVLLPIYEFSCPIYKQPIKSIPPTKYNLSPKFQSKKEKSFRKPNFTQKPKFYKVKGKLLFSEPTFCWFFSFLFEQIF
jgi:hypothetical protein